MADPYALALVQTEIDKIVQLFRLHNKATTMK